MYLCSCSVNSPSNISFSESLFNNSASRSSRTFKLSCNSCIWTLHDSIVLISSFRWLITEVNRLVSDFISLLFSVGSMEADLEIEGKGDRSSRNKMGDEQTSPTPTGERLPIPLVELLNGEEGGWREVCKEKRISSLSSCCLFSTAVVKMFIWTRSCSESWSFDSKSSFDAYINRSEL